mgnify:CR=1 FL=1
MSIVFFFIFTLAALNGTIVYNLFKGLGFENRQMFYLICLCLISACFSYSVATKGAVSVEHCGGCKYETGN